MSFNLKKVLPALMVTAMTLVAGSAFAQASRTWVSGVGDDVNPCSRTAPCKTFAGAISKTAVCGEIDALDPAGYGAVTITKSITLDGGGFLASVLVSGTSGIVVSLTANDTCHNTVILRNLSINGINSGIHGVRLVGSVATNLHLEKLSIARFTGRGVDISPGAAGGSVFLRDLDIRDNNGDGIGFSPSASAATKVSGHDVRTRQNLGTGLHFVNDTSGTIDNSQLQGNNNGATIDASSIHVGFVDTVFSENTTNGLSVASGTVAFIDRCSIFRNGTGLLDNGSTVGFGDNAINNNLVADITGNAVTSVAHP
jgi:hypothetical protein